MVVQIRLPLPEMERLCQLIVRYSSLCYSQGMILEFDPMQDYKISEERQLADALRQVSSPACGASVNW